MKFNELRKVIGEIFNADGGHVAVPFIVGAPGGGKSACARAIAMDLQDKFGIPDSRVVEFNPSLRDPVDIMGLPFKSEDGTHSEWLPPEEFYNIRAGQGPSVLILEELSDASMQMQNPLCRVVLDRYAGQMQLSEKLFIIATGNRIEDKSGANRMSTKLGNRMCILEFESNLEDWCKWATDAQLPRSLIQFIRFRPSALNDFKPDRVINPTPRSWEMVGRTPQFTNDKHLSLYQRTISGFVGDGPAAEYVGYLNVVNELPDFSALIKDPEHYPISDKLNIVYATLMKLIDMIDTKGAKKADIDNILLYISRTQPELRAYAWQEMMRSKDIQAKVMASKNFSRVVGQTINAVY